VAPLRYLAFCIASLKRIDRIQKHDDAALIEEYGSLYEM
jgi:hypothetical protein